MNINESDFPQELSKNISRIVIPNTHPIFYGSIAKPELIFKGDIDIITNMEVNDRDFTMKQLKTLIKAISLINDGSIYISEIKFGEDEEIKEHIDNLTKHKNFDKQKLIDYIDNLKKPNAQINSLLKNKMTDENYYKLLDELREYYVKRWTAKEIIEGKADEELKQNAPVFKFDVQVYNGFRYIEMSNFIVFKPLKETTKGQSKDKFIESLKDNIYKTYYSDNNIYKLLKRFYSYFRQIKKHKQEHIIEDIINNPESGNLYIILTIMKVHRTLIEFNKDKIDNDKFKKSLDSIKMNTIYLDQDMREEINKIIDNLNKLEPKNILSKLDDIIDKIQNILNKTTNSILKEHKMSIPQLLKNL